MTPRYSLPILGLAALSLAACNDPGFRGVPEVRLATAAEVGQCRLIETLTNTPGVYGPLAKEGERYARNKILESARADGANTVVIDPVPPGEPVYELKARAYAC